MNASKVVETTAAYLGYTQAEMAAAIGISVKTYTRRIAKPGSWTIGEIEKVARLSKWQEEDWTRIWNA